MVMQAIRVLVQRAAERVPDRGEVGNPGAREIVDILGNIIVQSHSCNPHVHGCWAIHYLARSTQMGNIM